MRGAHACHWIMRLMPAYAGWVKLLVQTTLGLQQTYALSIRLEAGSVRMPTAPNHPRGAAARHVQTSIESFFD